jgi:uncharacterized protein YqgC (DUF456 family)
MACVITGVRGFPISCFTDFFLKGGANITEQSTFRVQQPKCIFSGDDVIRIMLSLLFGLLSPKNIRMETDLLLAIAGAFFMLLGVIGSVAPLLPGAPLCYAGLLALHFTDKAEFSTTFLAIWLVIVLVVSVVDYFIPIWGAKRFGGTSNGLWGATIGMFVGFFVLPGIGMLPGTVLGAFIGEMTRHQADVKLAARAALGSLMGFVFSTALKLLVCLAMAFYFVKEMIASFAA